MHDRNGGQVSSGAATVRALNKAEEALSALDPRFPRLTDAVLRQDPGEPVTRVLRAVWAQMLGQSWDAGSELGAARRTGLVERETSLLGTAHQWVTAGPSAAAAPALAHLDRWPDDLTAMQIAFWSLLLSGERGARERAFDLVESVAARHPGDWRLQGSLAMVRQEQGRLDEAGALAEAALSVRPDAGNAVHARAHVHYESGTHAVGQRWLDDWRSGHEVLMHQAHFAWHAALHALALGRPEDALARYREGIGPAALADAGSLLWRCRLGGPVTGVDCAAPARAAAPVLAALPLPFPVFNAALALAAGDDEAGLAALRARCAADPRPAFADLLAPVVGALLALLHDRPADAVAGLLPLLEDLPRVGGSNAQREVVEDTLLVALLRAERLDDARIRLEARIARRDHGGDRALLAHMR